MSSYRGHFRDLSPSDQQDIMSFTQPDEPDCALCGTLRNIDHDASVTAGMWICTPCVETTLQAEVHQ